jgi:hypothetical protein
MSKRHERSLASNYSEVSLWRDDRRLGYRGDPGYGRARRRFNRAQRRFSKALAYEALIGG